MLPDGNRFEQGMRGFVDIFGDADILKIGLAGPAPASDVRGAAL